MELKRNLKRYVTGDDVRWVKDYLFSTGYYTDGIKGITNNRFGNDTYKAVKKFQEKYNLVVDGIVGKNTFGKITELLKNTEPDTTEYITAETHPRISEPARDAINEALRNVSHARRRTVLEALEYATDASIASQFDFPLSLYIRGGNLYNKDNTLNIISEKYLTGSYKKTYASYCTRGRLEMMIEAAIQNPYITGADCSGGIIGIFRHFGFISMKTDDTANGLCGSGYSTKIDKVDLMAGDFVGRSGHICLYVGGGYMVEWAGGEYGCQLTKMSDHKCWSFTDKKYKTQKTCAKYRRPKVY